MISKGIPCTHFLRYFIFYNISADPYVPEVPEPEIAAEDVQVEAGVDRTAQGTA